MKHSIVTVLSIFLFATYSSAQSVSKELATQVALRYFWKNIDNSPKQSVRNSNITSVDTTITEIISPSNICPLYLVQFDEGWVLVSSELTAKPVLASSPSGHFPSEEERPDGLKWLLSYYERELQYAKDSLSENPTDSRWYLDSLPDEESEIAPASVTALPVSYVISGISAIRWGQSKNNDYYVTSSNVYNKFCPTWFTPSNGHTLVGCTAVAMGIVMHYYQWPHSAIIPNSVDRDGNPSVNVHISTYNWNMMPYEIHNSTDTIVVNEVAGFLRDCGYASKMEYKASESGASLRDAAEALENNFHYESVSYHTRSRYIGNWLKKLKTEISENRPVIYAGYYPKNNSLAGHSFVLYGYNENDEFHINWGWRGDGNVGTYSIDNLVPRVVDAHSYNDEQEALWGIEPDLPTCTYNHTITTAEVSSQDFEIYNNKKIIGQNKTINNNHSGVIYSNQEVRLLPPFHIRQGASVSVGIRNMHCDLSNNTTNASMTPMYINTETTITEEVELQNYQFFTISPNPVQNILTIEGCESISPEFTIYSMYGQIVLRAIGTSIDVSALPKGVYLLTCNGEGYRAQCKFIKE